MGAAMFEECRKGAYICLKDIFECSSMDSK